MFLVQDGYVEVHGVDPEKWAKRHGIDLTGVEGECYSCNKHRKPSIPVVQGKSFGLITPPCECGDDSVAPYVLRCPGVDHLSSDGLSVMINEALEAQKKAQRIRKRRAREAYNKKRRDVRRAAKENR